MNLVCKLCMIEREFAHLPPEIDSQPRFHSSDDLLDHWNSTHESAMKLTGREACWRGILIESQNLHEGFIVYSGDVHATYDEFYCLRCGHKTSDPLASELAHCPACGRQYVDHWKELRKYRNEPTQAP